jgi:hypothetical protein
MRQQWGRIAIVVSALAVAYAPIPPGPVERHYSTRVYVALQHLLTSASNRLSFALFDLLIAIVVALWIAFAWRDVRRSPTWPRAAARVGGRTIVWSAAMYLMFIATWGLNYRRPRLAEKLPYDASSVTADAALAAARLTVDRLNQLHPIAHANGWPPARGVDPSLADGFGHALRDVRLPPSIVVARPKRTLIDWYFRRVGVAGMTDPFFLETLIASDALPFERPFVVAHEWSHLAGVTDEGDANFVGWLACMRGGVTAQYSGWLFLYRELAATVGGRDRAALGAALGPGPREDLRAIRERFAREVSPRLSAAGWRVYDSYLKANRVEAGAASYADVVKLVLGVRLAGQPALDAASRALPAMPKS